MMREPLTLPERIADAPIGGTHGCADRGESLPLPASGERVGVRGYHRQESSGQLSYGFFSASAATCILMILSGLVTAPLRAESPFLILSILSMPDTTVPQIV